MEFLTCNIGEYKRKINSLNNKIVLLRTDLIYDDDFISGIKFRILGTTDKIYNVILSKIVDKITCNCNCPDYTRRKVDCKHIYWIGYKKFGNFSPVHWQPGDYISLIIETWFYDYEDDCIGRNDVCPICLEEIDHETERTICCKDECENSVHSVCWNKHYESTGKTQCVMCRTNMIPFIL
jgi:hypothetical protein